MVGLFIFLLDAYDHYTGGNRRKSYFSRISSGESENLMYKKLYLYLTVASIYTVSGMYVHLYSC